MSEQPKESTKEFAKKKLIEKLIDLGVKVFFGLFVFFLALIMGEKINIEGINIGGADFKISKDLKKESVQSTKKTDPEVEVSLEHGTQNPSEETNVNQVETKTSPSIPIKKTAPKSGIKYFSIVYGEPGFQSTPRHSTIFKELVKELSNSLLKYSNSNPGIQIVITTDNQPISHKGDQLKFTGGYLKINIDEQECFLEMSLDVDQVSINTRNYFIKGYEEVLNTAIIKNKEVILKSIKDCLD